MSMNNAAVRSTPRWVGGKLTEMQNCPAMTGALAFYLRERTGNCSPGRGIARDSLIKKHIHTIRTKKLVVHTVLPALSREYGA
jgi:hypothetical protein